MKKIFRLSFRSVTRHLKMSILIMLQIMILFVGLNTLIASRNQQKSLIQPYSKFLEKKGYYLPLKATPMFDRNEIDIVEHLNGEWETTTFSRYSFILEGNANTNCKIIVYPDDFWDSYSPSLLHGRKPKSSTTNSSPWCVATANYNCKSVAVPGFDETLTVKGVLAEKCYIPDMDSWNLHASIKENLYKTFNISQTDHMYLLMPQSQWDKFNKGKAEPITQTNCIAVLKSKLTDEQAAENEKLLQDLGAPQLELSVLKERAHDDLSRNNRRFLPLLIAQTIITIFGIICAAAIQAMRDGTVTSIYKLCGMNNKHSTLFAAGNSAILLGLSSCLIIITYFVTQLWGIHAKYGLRFGLNNIIITLFIMMIMLLSSIITTKLVIKRSELSLTLRRE